jgi:hypothetical protein
MSGYLARLVAAAQRPGGSVHPMGVSVYGERGPSDRRDDVQPGVLDDTRPAEDLSHHAGAVAGMRGMEVPPFVQLLDAKDGELLSRPQVVTPSEERPIVMGRDASTPPRPKSHAELPLGDVRERRELTPRDPQATRPTDRSQAGTVNWGNESRAGRNPDFDLRVETWDRKMEARADAAGSAETMIPGMRRAIAGATSETPRREERPAGSREAALVPAASTDLWPGEPLQPLLHPVPGPQPRAANAVMPISRSHGDKSKRDPSRQREAPQRQQDEIQIHIGRIEVTAAQPAPVRSAPMPMRKTPSLDDYLRRGNERA